MTDKKEDKILKNVANNVEFSESEKIGKIAKEVNKSTETVRSKNSLLRLTKEQIQAIIEYEKKKEVKKIGN